MIWKKSGARGVWAPQGPPWILWWFFKEFFIFFLCASILCWKLCHLNSSPQFNLSSNLEKVLTHSAPFFIWTEKGRATQRLIRIPLQNPSFLFHCFLQLINPTLNSNLVERNCRTLSPQTPNTLVKKNNNRLQSVHGSLAFCTVPRKNILCCDPTSRWFGVKWLCDLTRGSVVLKALVP